MPETLMHMTPYYPPAITQSLTHAKDVQAAKELWEFLFRPTFPEPHTCLVFSKYLFNNWIYDLIKSSEQSRRDRYYCPHFCCCSVAKCPTFCDPMDCRTPSFPVLHYLPEFAQTHVHRVGDAFQASHPLSYPSPPAPNPSQHQGLFQRVSSSHQVAKVLELQLQH